MRKVLALFGLSAILALAAAFHLYDHWALKGDLRPGESVPAAEAAGGDAEEPYIPASSSTWGDLYRHFDPQGFGELPEEMQVQLDGIPLERTGENAGRPVEEFISTQEYLYPEE